MSETTPITSIGDGYSTFLGSAFSTFLETKVQNGGPANISTLVKVCLTTGDVYEALSINALAELSSLWGSFSDWLDFAHSITQQTWTVNILVVAKM